MAKNTKRNFHKRKSKGEHFFIFKVDAFLHKSKVSRYKVVSAGKIQIGAMLNLYDLETYLLFSPKMLIGYQKITKIKKLFDF